MINDILRRPPWRSSALSIAVGLALSACAVGPDFHAPEAPKVADASHPYTPAPLPAMAASNPSPAYVPQHFVDGQDISATWWEAFQSPALNALVQSALAHSPTVTAAQATLRQAEENYRADYGSKVFPSVSGQLQGARQRYPVAQGEGIPAGYTANLFTAALDVSYTLDVFGGNKRELEGVRAAIDYQRFQVEATWLSLTSSVVATAIQEASLRAQLQVTRDVVDNANRSLKVIDAQVRLGALARGALLQQQTLIAQQQAQIPPLEKALAQTRHQLAVLAGRLPGDDGLPTFDIDSLTLPRDLPVSVPSALVRQRPDIRASEAQLHEASAQIGVATAALYPNITLSGSVDRESFKLGRLFDTGTTGWSLVGGLVQPIFNGGALQARKRASVAAYDAAQAQYQSTVLNAFLNVANTLRAVDTDADEVTATADAERLANEALRLVERQYQLGAVSYLASLDAQRTYLSTRVALVQARAARFTDTAALFQALGGGWWNAPDAVASAASASSASH
ncbi:efflux transporter outer membrane subunit [Scleromatobacter humisilvae]|uniref:Efflux transporter outer membrane subunit n=1 Tax=Scleromatobacter humisilvae TaxID=2897159 RepID=A0A9X1YGA7_9BURK|nr:efflux transporter outer membrane subunit [Scleromatobacter humisilvae]MCK9684148.1 efflux transporter outer membrane subunit [Scleromatobacter humisilvae]